MKSDRVRSAARTRSRSAGRRRSTADSTGEATYGGQAEEVVQNNNYERKRTPQRLTTPKEKIESESFNDADDGANGFF